MFFWINKGTGKVIEIPAMTMVNGVLASPSIEQCRAEVVNRLGIPATDLLPFQVLDLDTAESLNKPIEALVATLSADGSQVLSISVDPAWQPPAPTAPDTSLLDGLAELAQVVARNVAVSPHDRRFLMQKDIGKQAIKWIRQHPLCTPDEAEQYIMALVLAELPGQPVVPKLYWEYQGAAQGLAMSYLHEAIKRGYCPPTTPMSWESLVALIVATPESQIDAWLRSL